MRQAGAHAEFLIDAALGCEVVTVSAKNLAYPRHTHVSTRVVGLVRAGSVRLERAGKRETLGPGDVFVIPPHQAHSLRASGGGQILSLCLADSALGRPASRRRAKIIARAMESLVAVGRLSRAECMALRRALAALATDKAETAGADDGMAILKGALEDHPERPFRLAEMAARAHLDRFHLIRKFRKRYGLAPRQFQNQNRLRKARRELLRPGCSLTQTALRAGFYDQSHFIRSFKRLYGLTPGQYLAARREVRFSTAPA